MSTKSTILDKMKLQHELHESMNWNINQWNEREKQVDAQ